MYVFFVVSIAFYGQLTEVASCFSHNLKEADWLHNAQANWKRLELGKMDVWNFRLKFISNPAALQGQS